MATSSSIFYRIIRAGIGVFCLLGLIKVVFVSNISDTTPLFSSKPLKKTQKSRHYIFARFCLKICYCSWPPNVRAQHFQCACVPTNGRQWGGDLRIVPPGSGCGSCAILSRRCFFGLMWLLGLNFKCLEPPAQNIAHPSSNPRSQSSHFKEYGK